MKIAIEVLGIHVFGGGRSATIELLETLFELDQSNEYLLFLTQPEPTLEAPNVKQYIVPIENRFKARIWAQLRLPGLVRDCDLVHFAKNLGVFGLPMPTAVTVYDMTTLLYPELFPKSDVWYWKTVQKWTLQKAARIIAISKQTATDVIEIYNLPPEKVSVIYPSCGRHFQPSSPEEIARVRTQYRLAESYILHVGHIDPKKNLPALLEAFARFREQSGFPGTLVLVGEHYKKNPDLTIYDQIDHLGIQDAVQMVGGVPDADLPAFYSGATITVYVSRHEGFGIVGLEAMRCGSPLIVSKAGALTEVVADAATILPENTADHLQEKLALLWRNESIRHELREKGLRRAQRFGWEESASQLLQLYREVGSAG